MNFVFTVKDRIEQEKKANRSVSCLGKLMPVYCTDLPEEWGATNEKVLSTED